MNEKYREILRKAETLDRETFAEYLRVREMWERYCEEADLQVDTFQYDTELLALWLVMYDGGLDTSNRKPYDTFDTFYRFMAENLV